MSEISNFKISDNTARTIAFSPDGRKIAFVNIGNSVILWDIQANKEIPWPVGHTDISDTSFSPDKKILATRSQASNVITLWDVNTGEETARLEGHSEPVRSIALSPDGKTLISSSEDTTIRLWDIDRRAEIASYTPSWSKGKGKIVVQVSFSPNGKTITTLYESKSKIYTNIWAVVSQDKIVLRKAGWGGAVNNRVYYSPNGETILMGGHQLGRITENGVTWGTTSTPHIFDLVSSPIPYPFSPSGKYLASQDKNGNVVLCTLNTEELKVEDTIVLPTSLKRVTAFAFSPDGKLLAAAGSAHDYRLLIRLWDVAIAN